MEDAPKISEKRPRDSDASDEEDEYEKHVARQKRKPNPLETLTAALRELDAAALANHKYSLVGKAINDLVAECAAHGAVPCTAGHCREVKAMEAFSVSGIKHRWCRACSTLDGTRKTATYKAERKRAIAVAIEAIEEEIRNTGAREDALSNKLKVLFELYDLEFLILGELRRCDVLVRSKGSNEDWWLRIQLKSSVWHEDRTGQQATFNSTRGYGDSTSGDEHRMLVLCGAYDAPTNGSNEIDGELTLWLVDGAKVPLAQMHAGRTNKTLCASTTNDLGKGAYHKTIEHITRQVKCVLTNHTMSPFRFMMTSYNDAWCDFKHDDQLKEAMGMLAYGRIGGVGSNGAVPTLVFPRGFQTVVDVTIDGQATQAKTIDTTTGQVSLNHRVKRAHHRPYSYKDGIDLIYACVIVKAREGGFYLVYASLTADELLLPRKVSKEHNEMRTYFATEDNKYTGQKSLTFPFSNKLSKWLRGTPAHKPNKQIDWLKNRLKARKITPEPEGGKLTVARLERVAHRAVGPMPEKF